MKKITFFLMVYLSSLSFAYGQDTPKMRYELEKPSIFPNKWEKKSGME